MKSGGSWSYDTPKVGLGSFATNLLWSPRAVMSATPLKADVAPQSSTVGACSLSSLTEEYDHA